MASALALMTRLTLRGATQLTRSPRASDRKRRPEDRFSLAQGVSRVGPPTPAASNHWLQGRLPRVEDCTLLTGPAPTHAAASSDLEGG